MFKTILSIADLVRDSHLATSLMESYQTPPVHYHWVNEEHTRGWRSRPKNMFEQMQRIFDTYYTREGGIARSFNVAVYSLDSSRESADNICNL